MTENELKPGMFFLAVIGGWTGRWVAAAQAFVRGGSRWTHAGVYLGNGLMIEAEPGGARIVELSAYAGRDVLWSDAPIQTYLDGLILPRTLGAREAAEDAVRKRVGDAAYGLVGTPYSFLSYLALVLLEWRVPGSKLLRNYIEGSGHLICSALVDRAFLDGGVHLFEDGRFPGDVTPGDLDHYHATWANEHALGSLQRQLDRGARFAVARKVHAQSGSKPSLLDRTPLAKVRRDWDRF